MKYYTVWYLILHCVALTLITVLELIYKPDLLVIRGSRLLAAWAGFLKDDILFFPQWETVCIQTVQKEIKHQYQKTQAASKIT